MRAYKLQDDGLDTIDANTALGFDDDERDYGVAARMLQILGCTRVKLLTNNPAKLDGLIAGRDRDCGPDAAARAGQCRQPALSDRQGDARGAQTRSFAGGAACRTNGNTGRAGRRRAGRVEIDAGAGKGRHG